MAACSTAAEQLPWTDAIPAGVCRPGRVHVSGPGRDGEVCALYT